MSLGYGFSGWSGPAGMSAVAGSKVELHLWDRTANGYGWRWFYRGPGGAVRHDLGEGKAETEEKAREEASRLAEERDYEVLGVTFKDPEPGPANGSVHLMRQDAGEQPDRWGRVSWTLADESGAEFAWTSASDSTARRWAEEECAERGFELT